MQRLIKLRRIGIGAAVLIHNCLGGITDLPMLADWHHLNLVASISERATHIALEIAKSPATTRVVPHKRVPGASSPLPGQRPSGKPNRSWA